MDRPENPLGMAPAVRDPASGDAVARAVESRVPAGWVPADVVVRVWARHNAGYGWETLIPEFSIAGMGDSLDDALENAIELLDDYFVLCSREGKNYSAARRPLPVRDTARLLGEFAVGRLVGKMGSGHSNRRKLDLPIHAVTSS
jgi:hypothetical protein